MRCKRRSATEEKACRRSDPVCRPQANGIVWVGATWRSKWMRGLWMRTCTRHAVHAGPQPGFGCPRATACAGRRELEPSTCGAELLAKPCRPTAPCVHPGKTQLMPLVGLTLEQAEQHSLLQGISVVALQAAASGAEQEFDGPTGEGVRALPAACRHSKEFHQWSLWPWPHTQ
jgi:hypothetical protein